MKSLIIILFTLSSLAHGGELCSLLSGAKVVAQDDKNTFLGTVTNSFDRESIFNEFGRHGSEFGSESIWNEFSEFGGQYSSSSPFNNYALSPPMLIKNGEVIGYLSSNKSIEASIAPNLLKALCEDML